MPLTRPFVCVDFDETIFDGTTVYPGCIEALTDIRKCYDIAIFSARATELERIAMVEFLKTHNIPFDVILPPKPNAVAFIDDKGIRFEGWDKLSLEAINRAAH